MSGSETGAVVTTREPFTVGFQKSPPPSQSQPVVQSMRLAYRTDGTAVYKSLSDSSPSPYHPVAATEVSAAPVAVLPPPPHNLNMNMGESVKRKRGRPRKYGPDGSISLALVVSPASAPPSSGAFSPPFQSPQPATSPLGVSASGSSMKKARGRPPGSSKKQQMETLGSAGIGFTPHIITVKAGEDVSSKIMSFSQNGPRAVCILSANGAISNVTLRQAATSGGTATYEGRFDILSLSGSFLPSAVGGQRSRTGGLSVSLAGPDGRVLGGCVAGLLTAASPVQVIVGSFITDGRKGTKANNQMEPLSAPQKLILGGSATVPNSPPSRGTLSESPGSSLNQSTGACNNNLNQSTGACNNNLNQSTGACNNNNPQGMSSMPWK